ncbi:MAG: MgtC/SapB family protein [Saprospiraceae bacterium]|nr:MgtC/SapB family protein [Lewinella sp.]
MNYDTIMTLAASLGLGLLVGLQREFSGHPIAGMRTFTLITLFGTILGFTAQQTGFYWVAVAGLLGITVIMVMGNFLKFRIGNVDVGQTTEIAGLLMFAVGFYLVEGSLAVGVIAGAVTAVLLQLKGTFGEFVKRLAPKDIKAIMQLVAITLIILPILPDEEFGPYHVLNPREIWLMVALIVGLGLIGYFLYKWLGKNAGTLSNGILGGLISSTATTVTYSNRSKEAEGLGRAAALIVLLASTVAIVRVLVEVAIVSPQYLGRIAPPILVVLAAMAVLCIGLFLLNRRQEKEMKEMPEPDNPAQMKTALIFGALYALILLGVAVAKDYFGQGGLLVVSIISGFTDVDAITLSLANTLNRGDIEVHNAWKYILIATFSNLLFKGGMVASMGSPKMKRLILPAFGVIIFFGLLVIWWWPS